MVRKFTIIFLILNLKSRGRRLRSVKKSLLFFFMLTTTILLLKSARSPPVEHAWGQVPTTIENRWSPFGVCIAARFEFRSSAAKRKRDRERKRQKEREGGGGGGREREIIAPALNLHPISNTTRGWHARGAFTVSYDEYAPDEPRKSRDDRLDFPIGDRPKGSHRSTCWMILLSADFAPFPPPNPGAALCHLLLAVSSVVLSRAVPRTCIRARATFDFARRAHAPTTGWPPTPAPAPGPGDTAESSLCHERVQSFGPRSTWRGPYVGPRVPRAPPSRYLRAPCSSCALPGPPR